MSATEAREALRRFITDHTYGEDRGRMLAFLAALPDDGREGLDRETADEVLYLLEHGRAFDARNTLRAALSPADKP